MACNLKKEDIALGKMILEKYERKAVSWPQTRWLLVGVAVLGMVYGLWNMKSAHESRQALRAEDIAKIIDFDDVPQGEYASLWAAGCAIKLTKYQAETTEMLQWRFNQFVMGVLTSFACIFFLTIIVMRWRKHEEEIVLCRIIRGIFENELKGCGSTDENRYPA